MKIRLLLFSIVAVGAACFFALASATAATAATVELPSKPLDIVKAYRYLEARSADFTLEFDKALDSKLKSKAGKVLHTEFYARLWATRILREKAAHKLAEKMLQTAVVVRSPESNDPTTVIEARKLETEVFQALGQQYISGLPLVDDLSEALLHMDFEALGPKVRDVHLDLSKRIPAIYKEEERLSVEGNWGRESVVRDWRKRAKADVSPVIGKSLEEAINSFGKALFSSSRLPAASGKYGPSTGVNGNLTGREFPSKMWALTYDDGPAKQTSQILGELAKRNMKATFFWLSKNIPAYAATSVARAKREGHGLANHSATHPPLNKASAAQLDKEILDSTRSLEAAFGQKLGFFRLPYGAGRNDSAIRTRIEKAGLVHVYWNVDTLDWQDRNPTTIYQRTMKQVSQQGRGVILFHDIHSQTVTASARVMDDLKSQGARVVTMQEALSVLNGETP